MDEAIFDDTLWMNILKSLSECGALRAYQKLQATERKTIQKGFADLARGEALRLFWLSSKLGPSGLQKHLAIMPKDLRLAIVSQVLQSMQCWTEVDDPVHRSGSSWKVGHA